MLKEHKDKCEEGAEEGEGWEVWPAVGGVGVAQIGFTAHVGVGEVEARGELVTR